MDFIKDNYVDGECIKYGSFYSKWYCIDYEIVIYLYNDNKCQNEIKI